MLTSKRACEIVIDGVCPMTYKTALAYFNRQDMKTQISILTCFQSFNNVDKQLQSETKSDFIRAIKIAQEWHKRWPKRYSGN